MKYWFDTEFHDRGDGIINLISIGVISEDNRQYYAVSADYDRDLADDWLKVNVLSQLGEVQPKTNKIIREELLTFFSKDNNPEFWADCGEYDWIVLRQLFGTLMDWPSDWTYTSMDIEQWRIQLDAPNFPTQEQGLHNALEDAKHTKRLWTWLDTKEWEKPNCNKSIANNRLDLTICLPLQLSSINGESIHLAHTSEYLKNTSWKVQERPKSFTTDSTKDLSLFQDYQKNAYFHPFVRRFLLDSNRIRRFYRDDIDSIILKLYQSNAFVNIELSAKKCELVLFQPNIAIFVLQLAPSDNQELSLNTIQQIQDTFRRLYPPYFFESNKTWVGGHCPVDVSVKFKNDDLYSSNIYQLDDPTTFIASYEKAYKSLSKDTKTPLFQWAQHWQALLQPFSTQGKDDGQIHIQHLGDDRAPIVSWIAINDIEKVTRGDWMRLCFADEPGESVLPYSGNFMQDFEKNHCYDRYWYSKDESNYLPSRILNCGYAFSYVGSAKDDFFTNKKDGAYFTYQNLYVDMAVIAHFQKSALLRMSNELSELVHRDNATGKVELPNRTDVLNFYNKFVEFTQNYWFDEISPQEQGIELFDMWRKQLRIQSLYDEIHQELKDLVEYSELRATEDLNKKLTKLTIAGFIVAILSVYIAIFSMNKYICISLIVCTIVFAGMIYFLKEKNT